MFVMKVGITNYEVIRLTGVKQASKGIWTAKSIGTSKATDFYSNTYQWGVCYKVLPN